jgi:4'-phosphopantetheinyl transferase
VFEATLDEGQVLVCVDDSPSMLEQLVARLAAVQVETVSIEHLCPACGSTLHGRPTVNLPLFVSRSRTAGMVAGAVGRTSAVGVDIESIARIERASVEAVLLHPAEASAVSGLPAEHRARLLARIWTAKEAILKLAGVGLAVDPGELRLERNGQRLELVEWPCVLDLRHAPELFGFDVSADVVGTVAVARN